MRVPSFFTKIFGKTKNSHTNFLSQKQNSNNQTQSASVPPIQDQETFIEENFTKARENAEPILEDVAEYASQAKDIISQYVEKATESINDIIDSVKEANTEINDEKVVYNTVVDVSEKEINSTDE